MTSHLSYKKVKYTPTEVSTNYYKQYAESLLHYNPNYDNKKKTKMEKNKFDSIDSDFKVDASNLDEVGIKKKIAEIALNQAALNEAKENDVDLTEKKAAAKDAGAVYREGTKANKQKIEFLRQLLTDSGKDAGDAGTGE